MAALSRKLLAFVAGMATAVALAAMSGPAAAAAPPMPAATPGNCGLSNFHQWSNADDDYLYTASNGVIKTSPGAFVNSYGLTYQANWNGHAVCEMVQQGLAAAECITWVGQNIFGIDPCTPGDANQEFFYSESPNFLLVNVGATGHYGPYTCLNDQVDQGHPANPADTLPCSDNNTILPGSDVTVHLGWGTS